MLTLYQSFSSEALRIPLGVSLNYGPFPDLRIDPLIPGRVVLRIRFYILPCKLMEKI